MLIAFIILTCAFYFAIYLQARAVATEINKFKVDDIFKSGLNNKRIVAVKGGAEEMWIKNKGIPTYIKAKNIDDKISKWLKDDKDDGFLTFEETYELKKMKDYD